METSSYSAQQRRAINLVWTASGDYQFEPQFLALKSNGEPDFYMNCVIGLVHKWFGDKMPKRLFAYWAGDARQNVFDELCWLALENAAYEKELPERPVLTDLRRKHAEEFFASEYQLSRQEWMEKNQLVYAVQSDRWKTILGQKPPILAPWEKGLAQALACPGTMNAAELEIAVRTAFEKYLQFDGTVHKKGGFQLHFDDKWAPLLTKLLPTEIVRTDDLTIGRSAMPGENGMVKVSNALRASALQRARNGGPRLHRALLRPQHLFARQAHAHRAAALHRQPPGLPPVVHKGRERVGPAHQRGHAASLRAGRGTGQAEPRRLRTRPRPASERARAPERANSKLPARPPAARAHPRPSGLAGRNEGLARTSAA